MPTKRIINARNRAVVLGSVVALYVLTTVFFLLRVNQYTQNIYDYPYTVSSQARIMQSRLYDFRSILPVVFASADLAPEDIESTLESQEDLQENSVRIIEEKYRGDPKELDNLKKALSNIQTKRRELIEMTRQDPTVVNIITRYSQVVEPAFGSVLTMLLMSLLTERINEGRRSMSTQTKSSSTSLCSQLFSAYS